MQKKDSIVCRRQLKALCGVFSLLACFTFSFGLVSEINGQVYVTKVKGNWRVSGGAAVEKGQNIPAGKRVNNTGSDAGDMIEMVGGSQVWQISCAAANAAKCRTGMTVPSTTMLGRLWDSVMGYWQGDKEKYTAHIVRGGFNDSVIKLENDEADLTSLFESMPGDTYYLKFRTLGGESGKQTAIPNAKINWKLTNNSAAEKVKIKDLAPGLYEIVKTDRKGEISQGTAWILVVPADKFEAAQKKFAELKETVNQWQSKNLSEDTAIGLTRAGLNYIAQDAKQ